MHNLSNTDTIHHVAIIDHQGKILADIDAKSTPDALAYWLTSRGIVPEATALGIADAAGEPITSLAEIWHTGRCPITGVILVEVGAMPTPSQDRIWFGLKGGRRVAMYRSRIDADHALYGRKVESIAPAVQPGSRPA